MISGKHFKIVWEGKMGVDLDKRTLPMSLITVEAVLSTFLYLKFPVIKLKKDNIRKMTV